MSAEESSRPEISRDEVERTLEQPEFVVPGYDGRRNYMRRYQEGVLNQEMLLRVVVEEMETESVVVTAYKTSQIERYVKGLQK